MAWVASVEHNFLYGGAALRVAKRGNGVLSEVTDITMTDLREGEISAEGPLLHGPECVDFLQAVMDAAYEYGLRPSKAQDEKHLKAHLDDMRGIARHVLKMDR